MEHILQPGDPCLDCQRLGLTKKLRNFYINLEEQILKCESDSCLYPYTDDTDDEDDGNEYAIDGIKNQALTCENDNCLYPCISGLQSQSSKPDMPLLGELQPFKEEKNSSFIQAFPKTTTAQESLSKPSLSMPLTSFNNTHNNCNLSTVMHTEIDKIPTASIKCKTAVEMKPTTSQSICLTNIKKENESQNPPVTEATLLPSNKEKQTEAATAFSSFSLSNILPTKGEKFDLIENEQNSESNLTEGITRTSISTDDKVKRRITSFLIDNNKKKPHVKRKISHGTRILQNSKKSFVTKARPLDFVQQELANKKSSS